MIESSRAIIASTSQAWLVSALVSVELAVIAIVLGLAFGVPAAWAASVFAAGGPKRRLLGRLAWLAWCFAAATPLILHAAAWESTAGKFGWWWWTQGGAARGMLDSFRNLTATGWIHAVHATALIAAGTTLATHRMDSDAAVSSQLDGGPVWRWWRIGLPAARGPLYALMLIVGMIAVTEMTVADLYFCPTLADRFYRLYAADPTLSSVVFALTPTLLAVVGVLLVWSRRLRFPPGIRRAISRQGTPSSRNSRVPQSPRDDHGTGVVMIAGLVLVVVTGLVAFVPAATLVLKLGSSPYQDWSPGLALVRSRDAWSVFSEEYFWTAQLGILAGITAATVAGVLAGRAKSARWVVPLLWLGFCLPGPIVGLAVVSFFRLPIPGFDLLYSQTLIPTVIASLPRTVPPAYLLITAARQSIVPTLWQSARLDLSPARRWWFIDGRLMVRSYLIAALVAAIVASGDVASTLPVMPAGVTTVGTRLFGLLHSGARAQEAALATGYLIAVTCILAIAIRIESRAGKVLD